MRMLRRARDHSILVRVDDVDAHCARARAHGARILEEPTTYEYGERQYSAVDIGGHAWRFSQTVADVHPAAWGGELVDQANDTDRATGEPELDWTFEL